MMDIDAIPQPGGFAVANHTMPSVGGSFRVMQAATGLGRRPTRRRHRQRAVASLIRKALKRQRHRAHRPGPHRRRFRFPSGAQRQRAQDVRRHVWRRITRQREHVRLRGARRGRCGAHQRQHADGSQRVRHRRFLHRTSSDPTTRDYSIVLNPTNTLHMVSDHLLEDLVLVRPIWSCNRQEARTLADRLGSK